MDHGHRLPEALEEPVGGTDPEIMAVHTWAEQSHHFAAPLWFPSSPRVPGGGPDSSEGRILDTNGKATKSGGPNLTGAQ